MRTTTVTYLLVTIIAVALAVYFAGELASGVSASFEQATEALTLMGQR